MACTCAATTALGRLLLEKRRAAGAGRYAPASRSLIDASILAPISFTARELQEVVARQPRLGQCRSHATEHELSATWFEVFTYYHPA